ncbi:PREDICTED: uncharacterized protein LOC106103958 [Papilio polytes]|uniref:uncharacterized protein LOC106103958 n=1 Tax=Papilio polytes TaxID=76194 RepID=UPI0006767725|nr:PREDICTED: uncharacterized protein LOC106103958 [Papilio polytes]
MEGSNDSLSVLSSALGSSPGVLLTPGRTRNIAQDMEALRLSRQDNPYLQHVMASRESLIDSHAEDCGSDDTILMSQEFGSTALDFVEEDPLTLKEVHEHMIRSPPPTSCWPHGAESKAAVTNVCMSAHPADTANTANTANTACNFYTNLYDS